MSRRAPRLLAVALAVLLGAPAAASAGDKESRNGRMARTHFAKAEKAFNLGRFADALAGYERAYDAMPLTAFLFNIGQCHRNLGHHERALFFFRRYVTLEPDSPNRAIVEELISEEEAALARKEAARRAALAEAESGPAPSPTLTLPPPPPEPRKLALRPTEKGSDSFPIPQRWVWIGIGTAVVAGTVAVYAATRGDDPRRGSLGIFDTR